MGDAGGPETVVDIDDRDTACTTVQHCEKCGQSLKRSSIADTGRDCDHRGGDKPRGDTRERSLHTGDGNHDIRFAQTFHF